MFGSWSGRYPAIARAAAKLRAKSFTMDGEAAVCGPDGIAVFGALHRRGTVTEAMLYAFDLLELDSADLRAVPLFERKARLARLVDRRLTGIVKNERLEAFDRSIDVHVSRIRAAIEDDPKKPHRVITVRGAGYVFARAQQ